MDHGRGTQPVQPERERREEGERLDGLPAVEAPLLSDFSQLVEVAAAGQVEEEGGQRVADSRQDEQNFAHREGQASHGYWIAAPQPSVFQADAPGDELGLSQALDRQSRSQSLIGVLTGHALRGLAKVILQFGDHVIGTGQSGEVRPDRRTVLVDRVAHRRPPVIAATAAAKLVQACRWSASWLVPFGVSR